MKKTIYLHLGTPKTGSTAFQYLMRSNYQLLQEEGIFIPKHNTDPTPKPHLPNWGLNCIGTEIADKNSDKSLMLFLKLFEESNCPTAVLSAENLSGRPLEVMTVIANKLKDYNVKPIVVFRHPIALMMSNYCSLGPDRAKKLTAFPQQYMKKYVAKKGYLKYGSIVSNSFKLFDNCIVIFYEKEKSILETLFKKMEFSSSLISKLLVNVKDVRVSLPPCAALLIHQLRLRNLEPEKYLKSMYLNLVAFTRTEGFINLRKQLFNDHKEIIVSEAFQKKLMPLIHSELKLLANTIQDTIPDSYFDIIKGTHPTDKQIDELFSNFILYLSDQNLNNIHSLNHYVLQKNIVKPESVN